MIELPVGATAKVPAPFTFEVEAHHADILGVSATMLFNVPQVTRLLNSLRERFGDKAPRIILGGAAFRAAPALAGELGAVGWGSDLREAVALVG